MKDHAKWLAALGFASVLLANSTVTFASSNPTTASILANNPNLNPKVVKMALNGYNWAKEHGEVHNSNYLTIINFDKPSYDKRLTVINLKTDKTVLNIPVAQGRNSGVVYATHFSNRPGSLETSLGVYTTGHTYYGHHGLSLRLHGLEQGINSNAYNRAVVMHPAWYMTKSFIKDEGRAGRSWGCFAVNPNISHKLIGLVKNGSVIFAYATPENHDPVVDA